LKKAVVHLEEARKTGLLQEKKICGEKRAEVEKKRLIPVLGTEARTKERGETQNSIGGTASSRCRSPERGEMGKERKRITAREKVQGTMLWEGGSARETCS